MTLNASDIQQSLLTSPESRPSDNGTTPMFGDSRSLEDVAITADAESVDQQLNELNHLRAKQLAEARQAIRNGVYGICQVCSKKISKARLEAIPEATRCVGCQAKVEKNA